MLSEPPVARVPVQSPVAVQPVAFVVVQASVAAPLPLIVAGVAVRLTVGTGGAVTVTVVEALAVPPAPVQLSA